MDALSSIGNGAKGLKAKQREERLFGRSFDWTMAEAKSSHSKEIQNEAKAGGDHQDGKKEESFKYPAIVELKTEK